MTTDNNSPFDGGDFTPQSVRNNIATQMGKGAAVAAVVFFGPVVFIYVLYLIGTLLPPESKEAVDPTPDSFGAYELLVDTHTA